MSEALCSALNSGLSAGSRIRASEDEADDLQSGSIQHGTVREHGLKTRARRAFGAARGVVSVVRACGSRIASRCCNRHGPTAAMSTAPQRPLSAMSLAQLDILRANLEAEEACLMEKLRELWQHLSAGSHLQPAFVDPDKLAHVTRLLLAGDTAAVERDPDNNEVSGAATMQLTSQRLEAALVDVHARMQAVCAARRRRKGLLTISVAPSTTKSAPSTPPRKEVPSATPVVTPTAKRLFTPIAGRVARGTRSEAATPSKGVSARGTPARRDSFRKGIDETPKRKLSATSLSDAFVDADDTPWYLRARGEQGVGSPRPRPVARWRTRLSRRSAADSELMCSWPAADGDDAHGFCVVELGYSKLPTHDSKHP